MDAVLRLLKGEDLDTLVYFARRAEVRVLAALRCTRRGGKRWLGNDDLVVHIRRVLAESPFLGEGYRKVWAKLRLGGIRPSPGRVMRLMREHNLRVPVDFGHRKVRAPMRERSLRRRRRATAASSASSARSRNSRRPLPLSAPDQP